MVEQAAQLRADIGEQRSAKEAVRLGELQEKRRELVASRAELEVGGAWRLGVEVLQSVGGGGAERGWWGCRWEGAKQQVW